MLTLDATLVRLDLATRPAQFQYKKDILRDGEVVFSGDAAAVWAWLRSSGLIA